MEGIVLQGIDRNKFLELDNKADKIYDLLKLLAANKLEEKITPEIAAAEIDVTTQTIYSYIKAGKIPASKVGRKLLIKRIDLENALQEVKSLKYKR